ncbi:citrate synthase, glyoxysomal [Gossypium australe]|uniref:Citrate synthase, glyoxysomal n=1 Tax=Gossypium australe TaxID=47621 RepID=A0A5B6WQ95_9ROSI|nr:citrate synthase, glyoxysomal [Gossypium australe]
MECEEYLSCGYEDMILQSMEKLRKQLNILVAISLEEAALSDEYFIKRKLYPNVNPIKIGFFRKSAAKEHDF